MDIAALAVGFEWIPVILLVAGLAFVIVEMLHPGFGAPGIIGIILLIAGIILYAKSPIQALVMIVAVLAVLGAAFFIIMQSAIKGRLARRLVLSDSVDESAGYADVGDMSYFVGSEGVTLTALRPSGTADFSGVKLDVVSEGEFIPKNSTVIISRVEGNKIIVKRKCTDGRTRS